MGVTIIPSGKENDPFYYVPPYDRDVQLEPNFFCRGRNTKREKYCRARAGQGTEHLGQGRCKNHGGSTPIVHGRYSEVVRDSLGEHIDRLELESEKEKLDILPEATLMRGIVLEMSEKWERIIAALIAWNEAESVEAAAMERRPKFMHVPQITELADLAKKTAEVVNMVHKRRAANAITLPDFHRLMARMADVVVVEADKLERFCPVEKIDAFKQAVDKGWREIKLKA
jgi:hypothetical protein